MDKMVGICYLEMGVEMLKGNQLELDGSIMGYGDDGIHDEDCDCDKDMDGVCILIVDEDIWMLVLGLMMIFVVFY